jgi:3-dehydroquinate synthase
MSIIEVKLPQLSYAIEIAAGSLDRLGDRLQPLNLGQKILVVSNPEIFQLYGERAIASLTSAGFTVAHHILKSANSTKPSNRSKAFTTQH